MKSKINFLGSLSKFFLLVVLFFNLTTIALSQILYTDIIPDKVLNAPYDDTTCYYHFDINQDGLSDVYIRTHRWYHFQSNSNPCCHCNRYDIYSRNYISVKIGLLDTLYYNGPCNHLYRDSGIIINEQTSVWRSQASIQYYCPPDYITCSQYTGVKYIPIKLLKSDTAYYGWIRVSGSNTYYDMAINTNPNQPIFAGQKISTNNFNQSDLLDNIHIYFDQSECRLTTSNLGNGISITKFQFYNYLGMLIFQKEFHNNEASIDLSNQKNGFYICRFTLSTKKVITKNINIIR